MSFVNYVFAWKCNEYGLMWAQSSRYSDQNQTITGICAIAHYIFIIVYVCYFRLIEIAPVFKIHTLYTLANTHSYTTHPHTHTYTHTHTHSFNDKC